MDNEKEKNENTQVPPNQETPPGLYIVVEGTEAKGIRPFGVNLKTREVITILLDMALKVSKEL